MNERSTSEREAIRETTDADSGRAIDVRDAGFLPDDQMESMRRRWNDVQSRFVDDPRTAVQEAHKLVTDLVNELTDRFARERGDLEGQWNSGGQADTEALRIALQRYRDFFNRLLGT